MLRRGDRGDAGRVGGTGSTGSTGQRSGGQVALALTVAAGQVIAAVTHQQGELHLKPFNPRELDARIRAILRRQVREVPGAPSQGNEMATFGPWTLDLSRRILERDGEEIGLTTGRSRCIGQTFGQMSGFGSEFFVEVGLAHFL